MYFKSFNTLLCTYSSGFMLLFLLLLTSCKEDEPKPVNVITNEANAYVNGWIDENMAYWYLWNNELPTSADKNIEPESYFESLLHTEDRFSWIQPDYHDLVNSLQGITKEAGYEYVLYREKETSDNVLLQVLYTKPGSPAATSGLKRGDVITHINGQQIKVNNYKDLLESTRLNHSVKFKPLTIDEEKFGEEKTMTLSVVQYSENPNYLHKVIETGGRNVGYFVYNFFASGTEKSPGKYDAETDAIFSMFKTSAVTDLVLDLRFNSGGSETSAKNLASLIGRGVDESKVFLKREYNPKVKEAILEDQTLGEEFLISHYSTKPENIGSQLAGRRVYVLTSSRTASASELIINALKPYMDVFIIGDTTYGKNVGSVSLFEKDDPKNTWGMQPIIVKVFNSLDQSDYSTGFTPNVIHKDNNLYLYPLGDIREALLAKAIAQISGTATLGREDEGKRRQSLAYSLDFKRSSFNLIVDGIPGF